MHEAARDNNIELARIVLRNKPNLTIVDDTFGGTVLDWAQQCGNHDIAKLIEKQLSANSSGNNKNKKKKGKGKKGKR